MRTNSCLGLMAVVVFSSGNASAICTLDADGTSSADGIALCLRYTTGTDRVYAAKCTGGSLSWVDICDSSGVLTGNVRIRGFGGNDGLLTIDAYYNSTIEGGCAAIECFGEVDLDTYSVAIEGGADNDVLETHNGTGLVTLDGGPDNDILFSSDYDFNVLHGGTGTDVLDDPGGSADFMYGDAGTDCLEHPCPGSGEMDCGSESDTYAWAGWATCCPGGPELCQGPESTCETSVSSCFP